jgi:hypothetical protein
MVTDILVAMLDEGGFIVLGGECGAEERWDGSLVTIRRSGPLK